MSDKTKKIVNLVANVIVIAILVVIAFITLNIILSQGKDYTSIFGKAYVAVQSDSMEGTHTDSFKKGDLIKIKILKDEEKKNLQVGDVITFEFQKRDDRTGEIEKVLNTHRIIAIGQNAFTGDLQYTTQGDKAADLGIGDQIESVDPANIVGKYTGKKLSGWGKAADFFHSSAGFFVCVVIPSLLIVAYFAVNLVLTIRAAKAEAALAEGEQEDEKEKMRRELLAELRAQGKINDDPPAESTEQSEAEKDASTDQAE